MRFNSCKMEVVLLFGAFSLLRRMELQRSGWVMLMKNKEQNIQQTSYQMCVKGKLVSLRIRAIRMSSNGEVHVIKTCLLARGLFSFHQLLQDN